MPVLLGGWLVLVALGVPVAFAIGASVVVFMAFLSGNEPAFLYNIAGRMIGSLSSFTLLSVVFFILAAELMNRAGVTERIVRLADAMVGFLPGGLGQVAIATMLVLSGMSGSGLADAAGSTSVLVPEMRRRGYPPAFAGAVIGASAVLGPLIPPSIPAVIYGTLAGASIAALFIGGVIPGLFAALVLMVFVAYTARARKFPRRAPPTAAELWHTFVAALPALLMPVIVVGGMILGVFTPTEAAVVASAYGLFLGLAYRTLRPGDLKPVFLETAHATGVILFIIGVAGLYAWLLTLNEIPQRAAQLVLEISQDRSVVMLILIFGLFVAGMFLDMIAVLVLSMPMLNPIIASVGIDPVHFGIVFSIMIMIGTITPPYGLILFMLRHITREPMGRLIRELVPFYAILLVVALVVAYVPDLTLFLPRLLLGR